MRFFTSALTLATLSAGFIGAIAPVSPIYGVGFYDARSLGMGNSTVGLGSPTANAQKQGDASLAYWNPAMVALNNRFGLFLPSIALGINNNTLSVAEATGLAANLQSQGLNSLNGLLNTLGSNRGLIIGVDSIVEPIGFSLGKVGPGAMSARVFSHAIANVNLQASGGLTRDISSLTTGLTSLSQTVQKLQGGLSDPSALSAAVTELNTVLNTSFSSFIKPDGNYEVKSLTAQTVSSANAALALTYAQIIPLQIAAFPEGQLSLGLTGKVLANPFSGLLSQVGQFPLPGSNAVISPVGGSFKTNVKLDLDREITTLKKALDAFSTDQNLATAADLTSGVANLFNDGISKSDISFINAQPDPFGGALDLGASYRFNPEWNAGLSLINPILLWGATQSTTRYDFSGQEIKVVNTPGGRVNFSQGEPFVVRGGGSYTPKQIKDLIVASSFAIPVSNGMPPSIQLGLEKAFGPLALRLGTTQFGINPLYTVGAGIQTSVVQANLAVGVDNPLNARSAAVALTLGGGF
jgi:hypothetical protein